MAPCRSRPVGGGNVFVAVVAEGVFRRCVFRFGSRWDFYGFVGFAHGLVGCEKLRREEKKGETAGVWQSYKKCQT